MSDELSIQEIVEIAIEIEKNGADFYKSLEQNANTESVKELFAFLATEEKRHVDRFQEILESVGGYQISAAYYATQYMGYMKALADERVFRKDISPAEVAKQASTSRDAIKIAIDFEKDSIIFLHEMREMMPEDETGAIQKLLDEERDHIRRLSIIRTQMNA